MYIKFIKNHPAGINKNDIKNVDVVQGEKFIKSKFAIASSEEEFEKYLFDLNFESRKSSLEAKKGRVDSDIERMQKEINILKKDSKEAIKRINAESKSQIDKINDALKAKEDNLSAYKTNTLTSIKAEEEALGLNK